MTDPAAFKDSPWKTLDPALLKDAAKVPTMLAPEEQQFYVWATSEWMQGVGAVVELGCFAGGSTARLAAGHKQAGHPGLIHAYDRFLAGDEAKARILYDQGVAPFEGNGILELATDLLSPWTDRVSLHPGQIEDQTWDGDPIEILVMDASKSIQTMDQMTRTFFPFLIPGRSLVVQQDYLFWRLPWIAIQMERLHKFFTPVACIPDHTVAFLNTHPIHEKFIERAMVSPLTPDERLRNLRRARRRLLDAGLDAVARPMADQIWTLEQDPKVERASHYAEKGRPPNRR